MSLKDQIESAKQQLASTAESHPGLFDEYNDYIEARKRLADAKREANRTRDIWFRIRYPDKGDRMSACIHEYRKEKDA